MSQQPDKILDFLDRLSEATWDAARFIRYAERAINPGAPVENSIANPVAGAWESIRQAIRMERGRQAKKAKP